MVGQSVNRRDLGEKLTGMLHSLVLCSPRPHANPVSIDASEALQLAGGHAVTSSPTKRTSLSGICMSEATFPEGTSRAKWTDEPAHAGTPTLPHAGPMADNGYHVALAGNLVKRAVTQLLGTFKNANQSVSV